MSVAEKCLHFSMTECSRGRRRRQKRVNIMVEDVPLLAVRCSAQKTTESAGRLFAERENLCPKLNRKKMKSRNPSSATLVALTAMKYIGAKA